MFRETRWLAGALAAAMWIAPAAAQSGSSGTSEQPSRTTAPPSGTTAQPGDTTAPPSGTSPEKSATERMEGAARDTSAAAGQAAGEAGEKAKAAGQQLTSETARTLAKLHAGNEFEISAGQWMEEHATNDKVKDFGKKMVEDHTALDKDAMEFAQKHGIDLTSTAAGKDEGQAQLEQLKGMQGAQADRSYMKLMVDDHTKDVRETRHAEQQAKRAKGDTEKELAKLLGKSAKKMEGHLKEAQKVQRELAQRQARTPR